MIKHFFSVLIFLFIFLFIYFVVSTYVSNNNRKKIQNNRDNVNLKIEERLLTLPILKNDTYNVIEFNSGYDTNNNKIKRNFWNLFKKND
jgi:hypothetical protein